MTLARTVGRDLTGRSWGGGTRRALLLHGSTSSSATWWRVGPALAERGWQVSALDLPGHGVRPPAPDPLTPGSVARVIGEELAGRSFDLVVGHSFGAAVALHLRHQTPSLGARWVFEELPGPRSVDWQAEVQAVLEDGNRARIDPDGLLAQSARDNPRWLPEDHHHAVADLAACSIEQVGAGLRLGTSWWSLREIEADGPPALLLLAPDAQGVNRLEDATVLRRRERRAVHDALGATLRILSAGHCIHRDDPDGWVDEVTQWVSEQERLV